MTKKKSLVVDTSVMVKWINSQNEESLSQAYKILKDTEAGKIELLAPELAKYEIGNALVYKGMPLPASKISLSTTYSLPITFIPLNQEMANETMEIATENKITYYDASFIDLAKEKKAILITANPKHQQPVKGVRVINIKDYR